MRYRPNVIDIASALGWFPTWRQHGWLPVAGDGNGHYYVLITGGQLCGCVGLADQARYRCDRLRVATNLWTFLWFLLCKEAGDHRWPFDRHHVIGHDPAMATIPADLQPWPKGSGLAVNG